MRKTITTAALATMVLTATAALAASSPADKCEASKNKTVGAYYSCREKAEATAITKLTAPDYSKCTAKFDDKWDGAETNGAGACPDDVLTAPMNDFIADQAAQAAAIIAGTGDLPTCGNDLAEYDESCDGSDLNGKTCASEAPSTPYGTLSCAVNCGAFVTATCVPRFDASGATIIDHETGLEWEKKDGAGGGADYANPHDVNNAYDWCVGFPGFCTVSSAPFDGTAASDFLPKLNGSTGVCYAGHCDWRLPTIEELQALPWPASLVFQPDANYYYESATTWADNWYFVWRLHSTAGTVDYSNKTNQGFARAVRGGL